MDTTYERHPFPRRLIDYIFWYPFIFLFLRGKLGVIFFDKTSKKTNRIRKYAKTFKSLEVMYTYEGFNTKEGLLDGVWTSFWDIFVISAKALRNRLRLMKAIFKDALLSYSSKTDIRVLSLASGSARGVVEVLADLKHLKMPIHIILADRSRLALAFSKDLANQFGVAEQFKWIRSDVFALNKLVPNNSQDIVEIVGFFDYLDEQTAINFLINIRNVLTKSGTVIISNINFNGEKRFLTEIVNWPLVYRNESELKLILLKSGFQESTIKVFYEPFRIHGLAIAKKS